ncbi:MAG: 30S ribosomal protein S14 [Candidatus Anstonellaceae archaeon]
MGKKNKNRKIPFEYRKKGKGKRKCLLTNNARGLIRAYGLQLSRKVFREIAPKLGFKKYS